MEDWSACDHFVQLMMQVIESSSLLLKDSFSPGSGNSLRKEDREGISTLEEKQVSLKELGSLKNNFSGRIFSF